MHRANTEQSRTCEAVLLASPVSALISVDCLNLIVIKVN